MIVSTQGESMSGISTHPQGSLENDKEINCNDELGDKNCNDHSLCVGFKNIQIFPTNLVHHKNSMINYSTLSVLELAETNLYWPSVPYE